MHLPTATPESQGVSSEALASAFSHFFNETHFAHGWLLMVHGKVVSEGYRYPCGPADRHQLFSLSKSFTSTAIGIALADGRITLDDTLVSFFPEYENSRYITISERMKRVTIRHLLTMSTGHHSCCVIGERFWQNGGRYFLNDKPWVKNILQDELRFEPGEKFVYNSGGTFLLSAILRKVYGVGILELLRERFFKPLGYTGDIVWDRNPDGIELGGWGLNLSIREIAAAADVWMRYGQTRDGRQLIPEWYMREALSFRIQNGGEEERRLRNDWSSGYGYQFWNCQKKGVFRGDGASGQIAVLFPELDAVLVATAGLVDMQHELNLLWDHLLPILGGTAPLPENPAALAALRAAERAPRFPLPAGVDGTDAAMFAPHAALAQPMRLKVTDDESNHNPLAFTEFEVIPVDGGAEIRAQFANGACDVWPVGYHDERQGTATQVDGDGLHTFRTYGRAAWIDETTLAFRLALPESTCYFEGKFELGDAPRFILHTDVFFRQEGKKDSNVALER